MDRLKNQRSGFRGLERKLSHFFQFWKTQSRNIVILNFSRKTIVNLKGVLLSRFFFFPEATFGHFFRLLSKICWDTRYKSSLRKIMFLRKEIIVFTEQQSMQSICGSRSQAYGFVHAKHASKFDTTKGNNNSRKQIGSLESITISSVQPKI